MTDDEKLAKEWIKKNTVEIDDEEFGLTCIRGPSSEDCFLAGLEAGRTKWHDLRKNPKDVPADSSIVLDEHGDKVKYLGEGVWLEYSEYYEYYDEYVVVDTHIAWCKVPEFKE